MHLHILIMAAVIGVTSAYFWHVEADWIFEVGHVARACIGPVDNSMYQSDIKPVYQCDVWALDGSMDQGYYPPGSKYASVKPVSNISYEVTALEGVKGEIFNCTKMDEYHYPDPNGSGRMKSILRTVYGCTNPKYYGIRGKAHTPTV